MEVILLDKTRNLGELGDKVRVKPGYGRNYLIPYGKAIPATKGNIEKFEQRRAGLEQAALEKLAAAKARAEKLHGLVVQVTARVADEGKLYGSIGVAEIVQAIKNACGVEVLKREIHMPLGAIRQMGEYEYMVELHTDIEALVKIQVVAE